MACDSWGPSSCSWGTAAVSLHPLAPSAAWATLRLRAPPLGSHRPSSSSAGRAPRPGHWPEPGDRKPQAPGRTGERPGGVQVLGREAEQPRGLLRWEAGSARAVGRRAAQAPGLGRILPTWSAPT